MSLESGTRFGPYEIAGEIGAGGVFHLWPQEDGGGLMITFEAAFLLSLYGSEWSTTEGDPISGVDDFGLTGGYIQIGLGGGGFD